MYLHIMHVPRDRLNRPSQISMIDSICQNLTQNMTQISLGLFTYSNKRTESHEI